MATLLCSGLVAFATTVSVVDGHAFLQFPISRQFSRTEAFHDDGYELLETAPQAFNSGGNQQCKDRGILKTDPVVMEQYGGGDKYPLYWNASVELAENGNYLEPNEIAKRHGVCGDPCLAREEDNIPYSTPNSEWEVLGAFQSGQVINIEVTIAIYHWGHMEVRLCDIGDLDDPEGVVTQDCMNIHQLTRVYDKTIASPIDPNFPGRYFVDPPCRSKEGEIPWNVSTDIYFSDAHDPYTINMLYSLPDIECKHCVMQMHYLTGHTCYHVGYKEFNTSSWNSNCAPDKDDWIRKYNDLGHDLWLCGDAYPEEFWSCADISISSSGTTDSTTEDKSDDATSGVTCSSFNMDDDGHGVCCNPLCPQCGGIGCRAAASQANLTDNHCCRQLIEDSGDYCNQTGEAPCILGTNFTTEDKSNDAKSGVMCSSFKIDDDGRGVCCNSLCPQCGGGGCSAKASEANLTDNDCCRQSIEESSNICDDTWEAPCVIP